jgi:hypothetical protein
MHVIIREDDEVLRIDSVSVAPDPGNFRRTAVAVSSTTDRQTIIGVTNTAAPRTITLASIDADDGHVVIIMDESGGAGTNNITIDTEGGKTINGLPTALINTNYGSLRLYSDGLNFFIF